MAKPADARRFDLVLLVVVDMLRGAALQELGPRLSGGLRYAVEHGTSFTGAHYRHATTFTSVGHAALATGAPAALHGIAGNDWAAPDGRHVYSVADTAFRPHLETRVTGTSPRNLTATTFSDQLVLSAAGRSRVFGVSIKDRGAILPAGRLATASYWYVPESGRFTSSTYYQAKLPGWVRRFNRSGRRNAYLGSRWELLKARSTYARACCDDRSVESGRRHLGRTMPKRHLSKPSASYYDALRFSPAGDDLTLRFARALVEAEEVGQGEATDVLTVSLSALDYIGHVWGPRSLEYEDHVLHLDRMLGGFLRYIDEKVGLDRTLLAVTSDHGSAGIPESSGYRRLPAGRLGGSALAAKADSALRVLYDSTEPLVASFWNPSFYLQEESLQAAGVSVKRAEADLAEWLEEQPGIARAVTRSALLSGEVAQTPVLRSVQRSFHPERSGNVLVVQDAFWYLYPGAHTYAAMHGSPYTYDTNVPLIIAGPWVPAGRQVERAVAMSQFAPSITELLGISRPSGAGEAVLRELWSTPCATGELGDVSTDGSTGDTKQH